MSFFTNLAQTIDKGLVHARAEAIGKFYCL
jgi:hypothetical protein